MLFVLLSKRFLLMTVLAGFAFVAIHANLLDCYKVGSYWVYFWANENEPLEPIHVHVAQGAPNSNATKIWITKAGGCYLCNNNSQIPPRVLRNIMAVIEARSGEVIEKWTAFFGEIRYFC